MPRPVSARAELCLRSERKCIATKFGRDFYGYELVVRNRGPGEASSILIAPLAAARGPWVPHLTGRGTDLEGTAIIPRLGVEASERVPYETVCDDTPLSRCRVRWVDGSGERREELAVAPAW